MQTQKTKERTILKTVGLGGTYHGGVPGMVDVKDGKIVRIRPFHFDWMYDRTQVRTWKISRNGKTLEASWKSYPSPCLRLHVY